MNTLATDQIKKITTDVFDKPIICINATGKVSIPISHRKGDNKFLLIDIDSQKCYITRAIKGITSH